MVQKLERGTMSHTLRIFTFVILASLIACSPQKINEPDNQTTPQKIPPQCTSTNDIESIRTGSKNCSSDNFKEGIKLPDYVKLKEMEVGNYVCGKSISARVTIEYNQCKYKCFADMFDYKDCLGPKFNCTIRKDKNCDESTQEESFEIYFEGKNKLYWFGIITPVAGGIFSPQILMSEGSCQYDDSFEEIKIYMCKNGEVVKLDNKYE